MHLAGLRTWVNVIKKYKQAENLNFCVFLPHTTVFILKLNTPLPSLMPSFSINW